jgi:autotransporter-associated beta strand protein
LSGSPAVYGLGDNVRVDDSASNSAVTLTLVLPPTGVTVTNFALSYQLNASGAGSLGGSMSLVKDGTNSLALNSANSFGGTITVKAGTLIAGNATVLGAETAGTTVESGGALNVNGNNLGLEPVVLAGNGPNGLGALNNSGGDQNNALREVTLMADTVSWHVAC